MTPDPELEAIGTLAKILGELEPESQKRVLRWAVSRFDVEPATVLQHDRKGRTTGANGTQGEFQDLAEIFHAADPKTEPDKVLVAFYWFQTGEDRGDLESQTLNTALKDLGHGISNITRALGDLERRKPALVRQVQKSGKTKQARKKYRLTTEGGHAVEAMLSGSDREEDHF